jgi:hypothetical protein
LLLAVLAGDEDNSASLLEQAMKKAFRRDSVPSQKASPVLMFYQGRAVGLVLAGQPSEIQALVREHASLVAVEHGEILGFLAIRPGHFYQRDFIDSLPV